MKPVLITAAVVAEAAPLVRALRLRREPKLPDGVIAYRGIASRRDGAVAIEVPVVLVVTGIGRDRAQRVVAAMIERRAPRCVIITGFAGGIDPAMNVGDVIVPAALHDLSTGSVLSPSVAGPAQRTLLTGDELIDTPHRKAQLFAAYPGAAACDMESAAIARCCEEAGVAWLCIRAISDSAATELRPFVLTLTRPDGRADLPAAILHALTHPGDIGYLMRLGRETRSAAEQLMLKVLQHL